MTTPVVGMGCTEHFINDKYPATITRILKTAKSGARAGKAIEIEIQRDKTLLRRREVHEGDAYVYERDPKGKVLVARWSKARACWVIVENGKMTKHSRHLELDRRRRYVELDN